MLYWTTDVVVDPSDSAQNTWYAGVFSGWGGAANYLGGLYRTTDRGAHWSQISNLDRVSSVTVNPNNSTEAFLTTETQGLWYTADIHATVPSWTQVASYPFRQPERVFYNPYNPNEIWVTSFGSGLFVGTTSSAAAPSITWPNPADITYGTALGVSQLDAAANVPGVFTYSPVAGTVLNAGAGQTLSVLFTPADTVNYTAANATAAINVLKATPTVTWANPADITYGTPLGAAQLDATASVPGTFIYAPAAGTVLNAGNIPSLTATFLPADAQNVNIAIAHTAIHVLKAHLTVSAYNTAKLYGAVIPPLTYTLGGFVNGDTAGAANGAPGLSATATSSSIVGTYPITVSLGTLAANNYDFTFVAGTLTVSKAHLTVSADNKSRPLNQANPPLTSSLAGFVGGDTAAVVSGTALLSTTAVTSSLAGVYPISASLGTLASTNYDFPSFVSGTLTVNLPTPGDYNGDGKTDPAVFRRTGPFAMTWFVQGYPTLINRSFGAGSLDVPLSGDFDGDGKTDPALYRPSTAQWFVQKSSANYVGQLLTTFGWPGVDIPVPADYVGNGITVPAVYRPTTGEWFIMGQSTLTFTTVAAGDVPVPGNYDNTGKNEPAIYRPSTSQWIIDGPSGAHTILFGGPADVPVPGAYDATAANPSDEPAVFRPSTGQWFIHGPNGFRVIRFAPGDIPAQGDYEGVGKTEAVVYRPATLQWFVAGPADAVPRLLTTFGGPSDVPPDSPYVYRALKSGGHVALGVASSPPLDLGVSARVFNSVGTNSSAASPPARVHRRHPPQAAPTLRTRGQTLFKSHPSRAFQVS